MNPIKLEPGKIPNQDPTAILGNMETDDNFTEIIGLGIVKLVEEENRAGTESEPSFMVFVKEL